MGRRRWFAWRVDVRWVLAAIVAVAVVAARGPGLAPGGPLCWLQPLGKDHRHLQSRGTGGAGDNVICERFDGSGWHVVVVRGEPTEDFEAKVRQVRDRHRAREEAGRAAGDADQAGHFPSGHVSTSRIALPSPPR